MKYVLTAPGAKNIDRYSIEEIGIPSLVLMERAALSVTEEVIKHIDSKNPVYVFASVGNNGADGLAVARMLICKKIPVEIFILGDINKATEEFKCQKNIIEKLSKSSREIKTVFHNDIENEIDKLDISGKTVVDSIFGIGLSREVSGIYERVIKRINNQAEYVISVDISSGLNASNGQVMGIAIKADETVTFSYIKAGMLLNSGKMYSGNIIVKDIGFPLQALKYVINNFKDEVFEAFEENDKKLLPIRSKISHKGDYGIVNAIGGFENMSGAISMAGEAAYRSGTGIVKIFCEKNNIDVEKSLLREAMVSEADKIYDIEFKEKSDVLLLGPGLGRSSKATDILKKALENNCKKVIDADALNIISENKKLLSKLKNAVLTPHLKEFSRLSGLDMEYIKNNQAKAASDFSKKYGCILVLKSATTIIADENGNVRINTSGNSGMSKGGSGDVLSGIIAGFICQKMDLFSAAALGCYIHGRAGDLAALKNGEYSVLAGDIINEIGRAINT